MAEGHTVRRCTTDPSEYAVQNDAGFGDDGATAPSGNDDWMNNATDGVAEPTAVEGNWMEDAGEVVAADADWGAAPAAAGDDWGAAPAAGGW